MPKTIKFNLNIDNKPIRTIEDLQQNFVIEDVLELYHSGILKKWLEVRGYEQYLQKIDNIAQGKAYEIIRSLIKVFEVELDEKKVEEGIQVLFYRHDRKTKLECYKKSSFEAQKIIDDYHKGYMTVIDNIIEHKNNMAEIKAHIKEIEQSYIDLFILNYYDLYFRWIKEAPLAVFALLMNTKLRGKFLSNDDILSDISIFANNISHILNNYKKGTLKGIKKYQQDTKYKWHSLCKESVIVLGINNSSGNIEIKDNKEITYTDKRAVGNILNGLHYYSYSPLDYVEYIEYTNQKNKLKTMLGNELKIYKGATDAYWKDIRPANQKFMIISIEPGNYVRDLGKTEVQYSSEDVNGKFLILDGINYMSNNDSHELLYMEV